MPINNDCDKAIKVKTPAPIKWPISGINAATKTNIPIAMGEGSPRIVERIVTNTAAIAAITI